MEILVAERVHEITSPPELSSGNITYDYSRQVVVSNTMASAEATVHFVHGDQWRGGRVTIVVNSGYVSMCFLAYEQNDEGSALVVHLVERPLEEYVMVTVFGVRVEYWLTTGAICATPAPDSLS